MDTTSPPPAAPPTTPDEISFADALKERYLAYALSTITARSLPDARDGLKPVHRRLLYAMRALKLNPNSGYKKCARIVGDVMGKFHPHGDQAIYDAMVRLAQTFAVRYPLVDGQGNFGNIDGDNAAAMRYTEARLSEISNLLLDGLDEDAVRFTQTYDGSETEPTVLPACFPNLLANGAAGIAVGMATSIPPHNAGELMAALIALAQKPGLDDDALLEHVLAPDFPTGGLIVHEEEALRKIYLEGRGSLRLRSKWHLENLSGGAWILVVEEIPFGIQKARLVERLALMVQSRKAPFLDEVRDESAHDVRLVLVPKSRNSDPDQIMETLFRTSELEIRFSVNMNVLLDQGRVPRQASLRTMLQAFIDHRYDVMHRQSAFRIDRLERRIELLKGYLIAYQNLDSIIHIIREEDKPKPILMERFSLSDAQAEAILNMRLRALRKLEEQIITKEHDQLVRELDRLRKLVESPALQRRQLIREFKALQTRFAKNPTLFERRSTLIPMPETEGFDPDALTPREPVTVICSKGGWMRCIKAHIADPAELKYREGDAAGLMVHALSSERILIAFASGRFYTLAADKLPGGRGAGEPLNLLLELAQHDQPIALLAYRPDCRLLLASSAGHGFVIQSNQLLTQTRLGKQIMNPVEGARLVACIEVQGDQVATVASNRRMLVLNLDEIPQLARGRGVMLQRLKGGAELKDLCSFDAQEGLRWQSGTRMRHETRWRDWQAKRATPGRPLPHGFPAGLRFQR